MLDLVGTPQIGFLMSRAHNFGHNIALEVKGHVQLAYMYLPMDTSVSLDIILNSYICNIL